MANKMTYAQAIDIAIEGLDAVEQSEVVEKLEALKAQLAKRGSGAKKGLTKTQKENVNLKEKVKGILGEEVDGLTATEVGSALGVTCQKASALLKQLIADGYVAKNKEGKVIRFVLCNEADEVEE